MRAGRNWARQRSEGSAQADRLRPGRCGDPTRGFRTAVRELRVGLPVAVVHTAAHPNSASEIFGSKGATVRGPGGASRLKRHILLEHRC